MKTAGVIESESRSVMRDEFDPTDNITPLFPFSTTSHLGENDARNASTDS